MPDPDRLARPPEEHPTDLGSPDPTGLTSIEREFVGSRLMTATIHADQTDQLLSLWPSRYRQDVPRLLREILSLRERLAQANATVDRNADKVDRLIAELAQAVQERDYYFAIVDASVGETRRLNDVAREMRGFHTIGDKLHLRLNPQCSICEAYAALDHLPRPTTDG